MKPSPKVIVARYRASQNTTPYTGNPDGEPIYPVEVDHGWEQPLAGGTDIMKRVVDRFMVEQGREPRDKNPRLASVKLNNQFRREANRSLIKAGLDGNGRFRKPELAYSMALHVLSTLGIEQDTMVSSHRFRERPSGALRVDLAFSNPSDPFSPEPISNSILYLQFTELGPDRFEAIAYLS